MPRTKRPLAEADPNATAPAPVAKRASHGPASCKDSQDYKLKTVAELASMLKERGLPHTGKKAELVQRLDVTQETISRAGEASTAADTHIAKKNAQKDTSTWDFITMCRPRDDIVTEKQAIHDDYDPDMENEEEQGEANRCGSGNCMCKKSPKDFPEWKWLITRKGYAMVVHLQVESEKRDQDMMGQYHYNDFSGYGFQEVVENHLVSFNKEYSKKTQNAKALWQHIEGFAHFLPGDGPWYMSDDSQRILDTLQLIGHAILATLEILESKGLLKPDSYVKDISLVLGLLVEVVMVWPSGYDEPEFSWVKAMISKAKENGIVVAGAPFGVEDKVKKFEELEYYDDDSEDEDDENGDENADQAKTSGLLKSDWEGEFNAFKDMYGKVGGKYYDLTKKNNKGGSTFIWTRS